MTAPAEPEQRDPADILFTCSLEDLNCLHDYMVAAIAGEDLSELPRLWNQQIGVIRSRQHPYPPEMASDKERIVHGCHRPDKENDCELDNIKCIDCEHWEPRYPEEDTSAQQRIADAIKELEDRAKSEDNTASICRGEARYEHRAYASKYREAIALLRENQP